MGGCNSTECGSGTKENDVCRPIIKSCGPGTHNLDGKCVVQTPVLPPIVPGTAPVTPPVPIQLRLYILQTDVSRNYHLVILRLIPLVIRVVRPL